MKSDVLFKREALTPGGQAMLIAWAEARIAELRESNDSLSFEPAQTQAVRCEIVVCKSIIKLVKGKTPVPMMKTRTGDPGTAY